MTVEIKRFYNPTKFQPKPAELEYVTLVEPSNPYYNVALKQAYVSREKALEHPKTDTLFFIENDNLYSAQLIRSSAYFDITSAAEVAQAISNERGTSFVGGVVRNKGRFWVTYFGPSAEAVAQRYLEDIQMDGNFDNILRHVERDERHGIYNLCAKVIAEGEYEL